jgi:RNA polymerase sigma-70 factor (ECF subfamily)
MTSDATSFFPAGLVGIATEPRAEIGASSFVTTEIDLESAGQSVSLLGVSLYESSLPIDWSDERLIEEVCGANREAFAVLFRRHAIRVRSVAFRILRNESEADDLLQEVFLYIFRKARQFDSTKGSARSWIVQVTYHRAIDRRRHLASRHFYDALALDAPDAAQLGREVAFYEQSLEGSLGKAVLERIEGALSLDQRKTLRLYFFEGCTLEEVARTMGQSPGNVRNHYYRALEKIRKLLFARKLSAE